VADTGDRKLYMFSSIPPVPSHKNIYAHTLEVYIVELAFSKITLL